MAKNKLDKESMFNRLMPSSSAMPEPLLDDSVAELKKTEPLEKNTAAETAVPAENPFIMVNIMELAVLDKIDEVFSRFNCCKCERCRNDVMALALNRLQPKYVIAKQETIDAMIEKLAFSEIISALLKAILVVIANPRH
ncbi:MAG: late competence development ComFB family protein [Oscillospiraceae bacterium]|jgi:hypothetical protein|nr:late competence development ComFB family protein [Oscillospiraceae bacterium]